MKFVIFALVAIFCGAVAADEPVSVINHGAAPAAAPAAAPVPAAAPAPAQPSTPTGVVVSSQPARQVVIVEEPRRCPGGRCASSTRSICTGPNCQKYAVKEDTVETARRRLFGGVVIRNNNRTVIKPVR